LYEFFISDKFVAYPDYPILLDLIVLVIFVEGYKL